ncbi:DivIVA domain protein [Streptococcus pyogenes GA41345]|nr:DivIVA domain protein [Streptococcus pyogenes GA41345]
MTSIIYSPKDIFEQEFKTSMRGFDKKEVDEFLDNVIKDYENFNAQIEALKAENEALKRRSFKLEIQFQRLFNNQYRNRLVLLNQLLILTS